MSMLMPFLKNFGLSGVDSAARSVTSALVQLAPETASAAELATMEDDLDKVGKVITNLQKELRDEQTEYDKVNARYTHMMGAAENLQVRIDAAGADAAQKASLEASLATLVGQIEEIVHELDTDKGEVEKTQKDLVEAEAMYQQKSKEILAAKGELSRARNDVERSNIERQRAEERAQRQRELAGLATSSSNLRTATSVLRDAAQKNRDAASQADRKTDALRKADDTTGGDPNIAAAMAAASGAPSGKPVSERLAALRR